MGVMSKNFQKPPVSSHNVQSQLQQNGNPSAPGSYPSNGKRQFRVPTTPFLSVPATPFPDVPTIPLPGIPPTIVDQRIRERVERYAQWLQINNNLPASPQKMQAYQDAALEINKVGKREVCTFAPFQERTSALHVLTSDQFTILAILAIYWSLGLFFLHLAMLAITLSIITLLYICEFVTSGMLVTKSFSGSSGEMIEEGIIHALDQLGVEWPTYTILCPLYKEATIVPQFVEAIKALDYPMDRLQALFLTEENDNETRAALYSMHLPASFTILTVPKGTPQTKPRACNFGLLQAKGQFVVIFDAEDKPEPYQLKEAVLTFANHGSEVACVQAKLNYYNSGQNLLTRWFTAEYSTWFDIMLPGLQHSGFSLPLGGTSNHFRAEVLRALGGWDAFNVTEDCDLGLRISQYGLKTAVLDSTTYEEATSRFKTWLLQRSRWIKGYLQTYLVHMRHPVQTLRQGQMRKFCSLQLIVGAWTVVLLINPLMWVLTLCYILFRPVHLYSILFPGPILYLGVFCLIFGNFFYIYIQLIGCLQRQEYALMKWVLLIPFYWVMMSISAYIAFYQLIVKPHHWEKTQHGSHLARAARAQVPTLRGCHPERSEGSALLPGLEPEGQAVTASMPTTRIFAVTVGRVFKQVAAPNTLEATTQRVIALRRALATQIGQRRVRRQEHLPHTRDLWLVATIIIACISSISACWYYFQQHEVLLYDDAYSHLRIARSVFDSATPGLAQLGSVWLPLQHILMWPFILNDYLWYSGLAGSFVSMPSYITAAIYLFLSARRLTRSSIASFIGTLLFIFNPNVLYLQSVPLGETVCMATLTAAGYYFLCWTQDGKPKQLIFTAAWTFLATLARYDGWALFLGVFCLIPLVGLLKRQKLRQIESDLVVFGVPGGLGIALWFIWNKIIFGDPLYFNDGPYSARSQQLVVLQEHLLFTYHNLLQALRYYTIDTQQTIGSILFVLAFVAFLWFLLRNRFAPSTFGALVFLVPFPFYVAALYNGNAVIWLPGANPPGAHIYMFNVRYGAQMVVPAALFLSVLVERVSSSSFLLSLGGGKLSHSAQVGFLGEPPGKGLGYQARRATQSPGLRPIKATHSPPDCVPSTPHPARPYGLDGHAPKNLPMTAPLHSRLYVRVVLIVVILAQSALIASQGIITLQDGEYNYACGSRLTVGTVVDYLAEHYAGGKILQDIYTTKVDPAEFGVDFKDIIYVGSAQLWLQALRDPVDSVEWIIVNPDNKNDLVAQHIDVKSPIFLSQFMLVAREADGLLLYYRRDEAPLPTRPAPPIWKGEHYPC